MRIASAATGPLRPSLQSSSTSSARRSTANSSMRASASVPSARLRMLRCGWTAASSAVEAAVADHLADQRVVVAHLVECAVPKEVGAAVADVDEVSRAAIEHEGGERRAHARLLDVVVGALEDGRIGGLRRLEQRPSGGHPGGERLGGKAAGDLAGVGAAHAVADARTGAAATTKVSSLVLRWSPMSVRAPWSGDERHRALTPRSGRSSRRCAAGCPA